MKHWNPPPIQTAVQYVCLWAGGQVKGHDISRRTPHAPHAAHMSCQISPHRVLRKGGAGRWKATLAASLIALTPQPEWGGGAAAPLRAVSRHTRVREKKKRRVTMYRNKNTRPILHFLHLTKHSKVQGWKDQESFVCNSWKKARSSGNLRRNNNGGMAL